jgi:hypothetical protein
LLKKDSKVISVVKGHLKINKKPLEYSFIRTVDDPDEKLEISVRDFGLGE